MSERITIPEGLLLLSDTLTWEALVREELGEVEVGHNCVGAPVIHLDVRLSVSHTDGMTVVMVSEQRCGVDVERIDRNFSSAVERYLTAEERALGGGLSAFAAAVWCAREAVYKLQQGRRGDGLMARMRITEASETEISVALDGNRYNVRLLAWGKYLIAWTK